MPMDKKKFAAFAKSQSGGKRGKGMPPQFMKKKHGDDDRNEKEHDDEDESEHAEKTEPRKKFGKGGKKGRGGAHEEHAERDDDHDREHEDEEHGGKRGRGGRHGDGEGHEHGGLSHEDIEEIAENVQDGKGDRRIMKLTRGYDPEEDGNPPSWAVDEDLWEKAEEAVEDRMDEFDEPWAVVASIYDRMGGEIEGGGGRGHHDDEEEDEEDDDHHRDDHEHGGKGVIHRPVFRPHRP